MNTHKLLLRWWLIFILVSVAFIGAFQYGLLGHVWTQDTSRLSFVIFGLFWGFAGWTGWATWKVSQAIRNKSMDCSVMRLVKYGEDATWFISDICLTLGMIGTVLGFIMMLEGGFVNIDSNNPATIQRMLGFMGSGMATALYTTLVGLICGNLLKVMAFNLTKGIEQMNGILHSAKHHAHHCCKKGS